MQIAFVASSIVWRLGQPRPMIRLWRKRLFVHIEDPETFWLCIKRKHDYNEELWKSFYDVIPGDRWSRLSFQFLCKQWMLWKVKLTIHKDGVLPTQTVFKKGRPDQNHTYTILELWNTKAKRSSTLLFDSFEAPHSRTMSRPSSCIFVAQTGSRYCNGNHLHNTASLIRQRTIQRSSLPTWPHKSWTSCRRKYSLKYFNGRSSFGARNGVRSSSWTMSQCCRLISNEDWWH